MPNPTAKLPVKKREAMPSIELRKELIVSLISGRKELLIKELLLYWLIIYAYDREWT